MIALACSSARGNLVGPTSLTERPDNVASGEFPHIAEDSVFITSDGSALSESLISVCVLRRYRIPRPLFRLILHPQCFG